MVISTRVDPVDRDIRLIIDQDLSPAAQSERLAAFAGEALADAEATNRAALGMTPPHHTFVDGREGAALASVRPNGVIVFEFDLVFDMLEWIGKQLVRNSPVLTGRYARSHRLFADGMEIQPGGTVPPAETYVFVNLQPYARKIERGLSDQAPDGVYQSVAALAKRRFGNIAAIKFSYRSIQEGGIVAYASTQSRTVATRGAKGRFSGSASMRSAADLAASVRERETRQPAIVVATGGGR